MEYGHSESDMRLI
jgi:hypothetical protein